MMCTYIRNVFNGIPFAAIMSITKDPESEEETKYTMRHAIAQTERNLGKHVERASVTRKP